MAYKKMAEVNFRTYKTRLQKIEDEIESLCHENGFNIARSRYYKESLAINLNIEDEEGFKGNVSLQAIHEARIILFKLDVIKTYDVGNVRYYHQENLEINKDLLFFESNIESLLQNAFIFYRNLTFSDLEQKIELPIRYS